jgi:serine/threonine protein phosphatase PrpC
VIADGADKLHVCNIGDSSAFLVIVNKNKVAIPIVLQDDGSITEGMPDRHPTVIQLNRLHKPEIKVTRYQIFPREYVESYPESYHIYLSGGYVGTVARSKTLRVNGIINMSRSIGDLHAVRQFTSTINHAFHQPEIQSYNLIWPHHAVERDLEAYVIVVTDGVTDVTGFKQNQLADIIADHAGTCNLIELAQRIADNSLVKKSTDNLSVCVMRLSPDNLSLRSVMVADGHGGSAISEKVKQDFHPVLTTILHSMADKAMQPYVKLFTSTLLDLIHSDRLHVTSDSVMYLLNQMDEIIQFYHSKYECRWQLLAVFDQFKQHTLTDPEQQYYCARVAERYEPILGVLNTADWSSDAHTKVINMIKELVPYSAYFYMHIIVDIQAMMLRKMNEEMDVLKRDLEVLRAKAAASQQTQTKPCAVKGADVNQSARMFASAPADTASSKMAAVKVSLRKF